MFAVWIVHAILRAVVLSRPDAFGMPFVGKIDWYLFHAWCFDARWIALWSLPFIAHVAFWEYRSRWFAHLGHAAFGAFHGILLVLTVADHEMQRFMGSHLTLTLVETYGNASSLAPLWTFFADDRGGAFLPLVLLFSAVPAAFWIAVWLRRWSWLGDRPRWRTLVLVVVGFVGAGWIFTELLWSGYNRARKLDPVVNVWWGAWKSSRASALDDREFQTLTAEHRSRWLSESAGDSLWTFPDPDLPYWKVPRGGDRTSPAESTWNLVLVVMESHRAANAGFMRTWGADRSATPFLDSIAPQGEFWTNYHVSALPTVRALTSMHLGILNDPDRNIVTDFPDLRNRSFSAILGERGWTTRFFSAADPAWDNQTPWLRQWYQAFDYSRFRETDAKMFSHAGEWMRENLRTDKRFLVTLMTKSNHYPFNMPSDGGKGPASSDLQERMVATMRYTETHLAAFVDGLRGEPWFSKTVFVFTADHGFPLGEHGCSSMGCGLYDESSRLPLVIWGAHPDLRPGRVRTRVASHVDLAPTLLQIAGVTASNAFTGSSLLQADSVASPTRIATHYNELLVRRDSLSVHETIQPVGHRERGREAFDNRRDPREKSDLWERDSAGFQELVEFGRRENRLLGAVLGRNALVPRVP
jgi:hypothetical protein